MIFRQFMSIRRFLTAITNIFSNGRTGLVSIVLFSLHFIGFLSRSRFDPNTIHDGIMYASAVSFAKGGSPNLDSFNQYGPLNSIIQGSWLKVTDTSLLSLRILSAIVLAGIGLAMISLMRPTLGIMKSSLISFIWNFGPPVFLPSLLPWSSALSTLFLLIFLLSVRNINENIASKVRIAIGSILLTLSVFIRIHMIPVVLIVWLYLIIQEKKLKQRSFLLKYFSIGVILTLTLSVFYFALSNSWSDFFEQTFVWPLFGIAARSSLISRQQLIIFLSGGVIPAVGFAGIWFAKYAAGNKQSTFRKFIPGLLFLVIASSIWFTQQNVTPVSFKNPLFILKVFTQNIPQVVNFTFLFVFVFLMLKSRVFMAFSFSRQNQFYEISFISSAVLLLQLYPASDQLHIWWIIPPLIVTVVTNAKHNAGAIRLFFESRHSSNIFLAVFLSLLIYQSVDIMQSRIPLKSETLQGMTAKPGEGKFIDETMIKLEDFQKNGLRMRIRCGEGLYSTVKRGSLSVDKYFIQLDGLSTGTMKPAEYDFFCNLSSEQKDEFAEEANETIFVVRSRDNRYNLLVRNGE